MVCRSVLVGKNIVLCSEPSGLVRRAMRSPFSDGVNGGFLVRVRSPSASFSLHFPLVFRRAFSLLADLPSFAAFGLLFYSISSMFAFFVFFPNSSPPPFSAAELPVNLAPPMNRLPSDE